MSDKSYEEYNQGMIFLEQGEFHQALGHFYQSLEFRPHFKTCQRIVETLQALEMNTEAEEYIEKAYQLNPNNSQVATTYAELLVKRNLEQEATQILEDVLRRNPTYGPAKSLIASTKDF